jgi:parallel beta-helix repeat protein
MIRKWLAVGIILLFVGTCIIPAIAQDTEKPSLPTSRGVWLYVGGSGPGNYTRIQDAINDSSDGDMVFVYDDSSPYIENIVIKTSISLIGENKTTTIIKPSYHDTTISIRTSNVTIQGFTIDCETVGGNCIECRGSYTIISNNTLTNGGNGIILVSGDYNKAIGNNISGCNRAILAFSPRFDIISKNIITDNGEPIKLDDAQNVTISYNIIKMNDDAIDIEFLQDGEIYNNTITHNGGGIFIVGKNNTIRNNYIAENKGPGNHGFGIMIVESENTIVKDNNIINNSWKGIDIKSFSSNIEIIHNNLKENSKGGFIISQSKGVKILQNNIIEKRPRFVYFILVPFFNIIINENYWNDIHLKQKILFGVIGVLLSSGLIDEWGFPQIPWYLMFPGIKIDLKPALEPYDIPGMRC